MRKCDEQAITTSTWNKVANDEPVFILRAQDQLAPCIVRAWADTAALAGVAPSKVAQARSLANQMELWQQERKRCKLPD